MRDSKQPRLANVLGSAFANAAVAALIGAAVGGFLGYRGALDAQNHQAREARASEERDIRREAYLGYLEHATAYRYATSDLLDAIAEAGDADLPDPTAAFQRWLNARADFQDSVNSVYVYGSDEAWQRHRVVARTLPYSVGYINQSQLVDDLSKFRDEVQAFGAAYNDFLELMCEELPATPRDGCEP